MNDLVNKIQDLSNWENISPNIYKFQISNDVEYRVEIEVWLAGTPLLTSTASLYRMTLGKEGLFNVCLRKGIRLFECLNSARQCLESKYSS